MNITWSLDSPLKYWASNNCFAITNYTEISCERRKAQISYHMYILFACSFTNLFPNDRRCFLWNINQCWNWISLIFLMNRQYSSMNSSPRFLFVFHELRPLLQITSCPSNFRSPGHISPYSLFILLEKVHLHAMHKYCPIQTEIKLNRNSTVSFIAVSIIELWSCKLL